MSTPPKELRAGRYVLLRTLGEGSQGETYEAVDNGRLEQGGARDHKTVALAEEWARYVRQAHSGAPPTRPERGLVAIKSFRVGKAKAWKDVELAEREARTLSALDHPRLPKYIEHFEEDGALYLVMEKIEGESLAALRAAGRSFGAAEVTRMLEDIGDALRYLHARSPLIVHRDVKPGNVIRTPDGSFSLVDFGSVRERLKPAGGSTVVGTFGYMAPEQFQGRASPTSDVYGLAATALAMLTGREPEELPHEGLGLDVRRAVPKGTPAPIVRALTAMLVPDPDRRVASVDEALALLRPSGCDVKSGSSSAGPRRHDEHESRRRRKRRAREERKRRRAAARARRAPFVPRLVAQAGLLVAMIVVSIVVGGVIPVVLYALSTIFGQALRRAARACARASTRSTAAMGRASVWLSGHRREDEASGPVRVPSDPDRVRVTDLDEDEGEKEDTRAIEAELEEREVGEPTARRRARP